MRRARRERADLLVGQVSAALSFRALRQVADAPRRIGAEPTVVHGDIEDAGQDMAPLLDRAGAADAIVFGAPTYMGGASAPMKAFIDATSKPWYARAWKNKLAGGFTNSGGYSGDIAALARRHSILHRTAAAFV